MKICLGKEIEEIKKKNSEAEKNLLKNRNSENVNELDDDDVYFHSNAVKNIKLGSQLVNRIYLNNSIVYDLENSINLNLFHSLVPAATATSIIFDKLENQDISNFNLIGYCDANNHIAVYNNNTEYLVLNIRNAVNYAPLSCAGFFANYTVLADCVFDNFDTRNTANMSNMFLNCYALRNLDLNIFNTANVTNMVAMFSGCQSLTSFDLSSFNTQNVTNMQAMFFNCGSLTSLDLSSFNTNKVIYFREMFYFCTNLTHLDLKSFYTPVAYDMYRMFYNCNKLVNIDIRNFTTSHVVTTHYFFGYDNNLRTVIASTFDKTVLADSEYMFYNCFNIIGSNDTHYSSAHTNAEYARVDGENGLPGYFTAPAANNK